MSREALLAELARQLSAHPARETRPVLRVGIDGVDGAGKTHFADELAQSFTAQGMPVIRASVDGFHRPRARRYERGRSSPEGFYHDSYDYAELRRVLLGPLGPGGDGCYRTAAFDVTADQPLDLPVQQASFGSVLLFDGLFLHRPELRRLFDVSVFLRVPFEVSIPRGASRGQGYGSPDPFAVSNARYIGGQKLYFAESQPEQQATFVIDNSDLNAPYFTRWMSQARTSSRSE